MIFFVVQIYSHIQVDSSFPLSPKKKRCLEIKITSKQEDQTEHPQTSNPEIFLTPRNYFTIPFLTQSTSSPTRCVPYHSFWKAGKNLLIFRMALLKMNFNLFLSHHNIQFVQTASTSVLVTPKNTICWREKMCYG